ncbi:acetate kinase [Plantactinospora sp. KBS50]|uniref:acetate kinase n=1 Tax=Plantactinospora sp. KBS50 TaxID=2024580 RepID=UPI000BAB010A|nr:acetate kinase [Plantactinospora sp. KBS50]ASW56560.1 acetate kinase [Plantactinospora sp. KBS50]
MTRLLVLNCGSSSVKYRLYDGEVVLDGGVVERVGEDGGPADHASALRELLDRLDLADLSGVGHRVVHGGTRFAAPTLIDDEVIRAIRDLVPLAPLHNPANLVGIEAVRRLLPDVPQVAVFDTAFHRTLPEAAARYAIDTATADRYRIRRYGFHGTSHAYVSRRTAELLGQPYAGINTITLHLGNGASACAVAGGRSVATSMGMSPLEGLVMGTRSGDIDPTIIFQLRREGGMAVDDIDDLLNHRSGLLGLAGVNDMRKLLRRRAAGDPSAELAFEIYCRRIREYVGAYYALLGWVDAITFTAGVGERSPEVRAEALAGLGRLGIAVDPGLNLGTGDRNIAVPGAEVAVCVVGTDEEREIARETRALINR